MDDPSSVQIGRRTMGNDICPGRKYEGKGGIQNRDKISAHE